MRQTSQKAMFQSYLYSYNELNSRTIQNDADVTRCWREEDTKAAHEQTLRDISVSEQRVRAGTLRPNRKRRIEKGRSNTNAESKIRHHWRHPRPCGRTRGASANTWLRQGRGRLSAPERTQGDLSGRFHRPGAKGPRFRPTAGSTSRSCSPGSAASPISSAPSGAVVQ